MPRTGTARLARAAQEDAGSRARVLAAVQSHHALVDRGEVTVGPLDQSRCAARQVGDELGTVQLQPVEVDDVHVALETGTKRTAIVEPEQRGGGGRDLL